LIFKNKNISGNIHQNDREKNISKMNRSNSKAGSGMSYEYKNGYRIGVTQINYHTSSNSSDNEI
jgi:hypothetical protein